MSLIESKFVEKTSGMEAYRVLVNFWSCIKIHVPNILSCVSQVFPHYTKHDVSHSYAILDSIERVLGKEAIDKLSVTDLWLLLCSAFYHDIGMYISGKEIQDCFESEKFQKYLCDLKDDAKLPLNRYAKCFVMQDGKLNYGNCELSLDSYNAARYLLADFFRVNHAARSKDFLQTDPSVAQMFSEIKRLITTIAEICRLHGGTFQEVMKCNDVENGVNGIEDYCHPRFVACMLRLGDLLDFDSSRVSRFSLDHLSSSIPSDSKIHNEKNYCIRHALITPEKVDVFAECKDVDVAFEIDKWFTLIREEMSNQRNLWHDIVADLDIKGFPMCGKLETKLLDYEKIDNNLKAKFEIDGDKATKILQGSGLYNEKNQCVREILQNAIDATYLRIYLERKDEFATKPLKEGFEKFIEICKLPEYQIEVECKKEEIEEKCGEAENGERQGNKKSVWHVVIKDHGIGMRKDDLKYLLKIGSGKNNKEKFNIINQMPEYAKPSGIFGIGFQSIFLITDKVEVKSRYAFCDEVIDMEIGTPLKDGFALLKIEKNSFADKGTTISFDLMEMSKDKSSNSDTFSSESSLYGNSNYPSYYDYFKKSYDLLESEKCDIEIAGILEKVSEVINNSYLNIICKGNEKKNEIKLEKIVDGAINKKIYNDEEANLVVELSMIKSSYGYVHKKLMYRNEEVGGYIIWRFIRFINIVINILSGSSDDVLTVSRESLKSDYARKIEEPLKRKIIEWMVEHWGLFDDDYKKASGLFIEYYGEKGKYEKQREWWKKNKILDIDFRKKIEYDSVIIKEHFYSYGFAQKEINSKKLIIQEDVFSPYVQFIGYVLHDFYKYGMHFRAGYDYKQDKKTKKKVCLGAEIEFTRETGDSVDWEYWLRVYKRRKCRSLMPCYGYEIIKVKDDYGLMRKADPMNVLEKVSYPRTVCPYVVKDDKLEWDCSDKVIQWVRENNIKGKDKVTEDVIISEYAKMRKDLKKYVKKINNEVEKKKAKVKKDAEAKDVSKPKKQVEKKAGAKVAPKPKEQVEKKPASKGKPKTIKPAKKQTKTKAKKS